MLVVVIRYTRNHIYNLMFKTNNNVKVQHLSKCRGGFLKHTCCTATCTNGSETKSLVESYLMLNDN